MSEETPVYLIPVLSRPDPLAFTVEPLDEGQPSVVARCGHTQWRLETLILDGQVLRRSNPNFSTRVGRLPSWLHRFFAPKQCTLCRFKDQLEAAIACAFCKGVIYRGEPVSICMPVGKLPEGFRARATQTPSGFVGCMSEDCCPTSGFFAGHWVGNGVRTSFSTGTAAFHSGDITILNFSSL